MNILTAELADLGRYIAGITGDPGAAKIALSTSPQLRYDAVVSALLRDPQQRGKFSQDEHAALIRRIENEGRRLRAWGDWGDCYGSRPTLDDLDEWDADGGCLAVDGCWVEMDGTCPHACPSWALVMGII